MDNSTDYNTSPPSSEQESCIDRDGREILDGFLYTPGHDACQVCTCFSGSPGLCRTVLCAPPSNCNSFRVKDRCCEWVCIDDVRTGDDGEPEHGSAAADIGLRLVACGVTAIFSLALLFFLIYRLRQRKMRDHAAAVDRGPDGNGIGPGDQGSVDSVAMTNLSGPNQSGDHSSRGYMYGWMWWKPQEDFVCQPPPPSYDDAVANDRTDYYNDERDEDDGSSSGSDAPSYSQIHYDAILQTHQSSSTRTPTPNLSCGLPVGATLVLPQQPAPPVTLHHIDVDLRAAASGSSSFNRSYPTMTYSDSPIHENSETHYDAPVQTRRSRSRNSTPNTSLGLPVGATLVLPQPDEHAPTRRSRSRNLTPSSSNGFPTFVLPQPAPSQTELHHIEAGHRTLPSSSRGRRSQQEMMSAEVANASRVPVLPHRHQRAASSASNTSLTTSVDV